MNLPYLNDFGIKLIAVSRFPWVLYNTESSVNNANDVMFVVGKSEINKLKRMGESTVPCRTPARIDFGDEMWCFKRMEKVQLL